LLLYNRQLQCKRRPAIINTLNATGGRVDKTANAKAYEVMSNLVGLVKLYKLTADTSVLNPVLKSWNDITGKRLYITGTTSSFEHFQDDYVLPASVDDHMGEGCVTTTWIQMNYQLLSILGKMQLLYSAAVAKANGKLNNKRLSGFWRIGYGYGVIILFGRPESLHLLFLVNRPISGHHFQIPSPGTSRIL
jgi:hypothetical protein